MEEDLSDNNNFDYSLEYGGMKKCLTMNDISSLTPVEQPKKKFIAMAKAIYRFHRDRADRLLSKRRQAFRPIEAPAPFMPTVLQSPKLRYKARSRPLHVMSQKEKEEMEAEEFRKFKIKANPIPKSVYEGCINLPDVPKKFITVPEPFNLTEVIKKIAPSPPNVFVFKARPAPQHPISVSLPITSTFHSKLTPPRHHSAPRPCKPVRRGPLIVVPFSFEKRDIELKRRHEERIKKQWEEERKQASKFKAQPLPEAVKKQMQSATFKCDRCSAKPPVESNKTSFKPILKPVRLIKPGPFQLATEKRAVDRERFDKSLKDKEEEREKLKQQREKEIRKAKELATAELRAKMVHHPKPVLVVEHPFVPKKSEAPLTVPETPQVVKRSKRHID
ncbi:targeting protein for Xklp2-like [Cydia pomonella]|uniref:targeting protein for Xklp2-like n=1 Tax=Cydia pomonella TaxID=82600 RepID=UPI002ADDA3F7|nr:targeting protein for Xklp2-like [Cydia pomonella]